MEETQAPWSELANRQLSLYVDHLVRGPSAVSDMTSLACSLITSYQAEKTYQAAEKEGTGSPEETL